MSQNQNPNISSFVQEFLTAAKLPYTTNLIEFISRRLQTAFGEQWESLPDNKKKATIETTYHERTPPGSYLLTLLNPTEGPLKYLVDHNAYGVLKGSETYATRLESLVESEYSDAFVEQSYLWLSKIVDISKTYNGSVTVDWKKSNMPVYDRKQSASSNLERFIEFYQHQDTRTALEGLFKDQKDFANAVRDASNHFGYQVRDYLLKSK